MGCEFVVSILLCISAWCRPWTFGILQYDEVGAKVYRVRACNTHSCRHAAPPLLPNVLYVVRDAFSSVE